MTQYNGTTSIPQTVRDIVANKISLLDSYILMQTGENEFTALVYKRGLNQCKQYTFSRSGNYGSTYTVSVRNGQWDYSVSNEYYCYSNVGYGTALDLPVVEQATAFSTVIVACALMLGIVFKGVLFPCLKRR